VHPKFRISTSFFRPGFSVDHTAGIYPVSAGGVPFTMTYLQSKGDLLTDLHEDLAAEQKARTTYDNILRLSDDPDVRDAIKFLRAREIVHYQRFGDTNHTDLSRFSCELSPAVSWGSSFYLY